MSKLMSIEEQIFKLLLKEAKKNGYKPTYIGCAGETDGATIKTPAQAMEETFKHNVSDITFERTDGAHFWVRVVAGNNTDFISDYSANKPVAERIIKNIYKVIDAYEM